LKENITKAKEKNVKLAAATNSDNEYSLQASMWLLLKI